MPARERTDAVPPRLPEAEALEQHADPLPPLGHAVQPAVQLEILERRQLAVDERLMREVADPGALGVDAQLALGRNREPGADPEERRLAGAVRAGHDRESATFHVEIDAMEHAFLAVAPPELPRFDHAASLGTLHSFYVRRTWAGAMRRLIPDHGMHRLQGV